MEPGVGLDCGTMNFVSARRNGKKISTSRLRDVFIDLPKENKRMLKLSKTSYIEYDGKLIVIGDEAIQTANLFNKEVRRPMNNGIISSGEIEARSVMAIMMKQLLGDPIAENEKCCYSVPAKSIDNNSDIIYHRAMLGMILEEIGYDPEPINESLAVIYSECEKDNFSGIALSFGSGMTNVCMSYNAMSAMEFSLGRGGDWVDNGAAKAVGSTSAKMCSIKEKGVNIKAPSSRNEEAIALYIRELIDYSIKGIIKEFSSNDNIMTIPTSIPIVISGGTSLADGFADMFTERFEKFKDKFPVSVSNIRQAKDPLTSVANGLLLISSLDD